MSTYSDVVLAVVSIAQAPSTANATLYTCPAGRYAVVKYTKAYTSGSNASIRINSVDHTGAGADVNGSILSNAILNNEFILNASETISISSAGTDTNTFYATVLEYAKPS